MRIVRLTQTLFFLFNYGFLSKSQTLKTNQNRNTHTQTPNPKNPNPKPNPSLKLTYDTKKTEPVWNKGKPWHPDCDAAFNRPPPPVFEPEIDIESLLKPLEAAPPPPKPRGPPCYGCKEPIDDVSTNRSLLETPNGIP